MFTMRTVVRVSAVAPDRTTITLIVPGWDNLPPFSVGMARLPPELRDTLEEGARLFVRGDFPGLNEKNDPAISAFECAPTPAPGEPFP